MVYPSYPYMTTTPPTNQAPPVYYYPYPEPYPHVIASIPCSGQLPLVPLHRRPVLPHLELHLNFSLPQLIPGSCTCDPGSCTCDPGSCTCDPGSWIAILSFCSPSHGDFPDWRRPSQRIEPHIGPCTNYDVCYPSLSLPLEFVRLCSSERRTFFFRSEQIRCFSHNHNTYPPQMPPNTDSFFSASTFAWHHSTNFVARPSQFILTSPCLILFSFCISLVSLSGHTAPKPIDNHKTVLVVVSQSFHRVKQAQSIPGFPEN
ncbi:hypothetical protein PSHT_09416 [Puccinia striiformis]|uniref:Uncharacterized protein n=1 Tax=Puccinia striiformis TaxID=27350 RepID=A0A2S4VGZ2_9BASI|nr:hypothetical protein PSHT_09416 [Puccinia striiformis]